MKMQVNGNMIKSLREKRVWSQQQLAEMAGISLRTLQRLEATSTASHETVKSLAAVFEIDAETLLPPKASDEASTATSNPIEKRNFIISLFALIIAHVIGFYGVFDAFGREVITEDVFKLVKNLLSINLLVTMGICLYRGYKKGLLDKSDLL